MTRVFAAFLTALIAVAPAAAQVGSGATVKEAKTTFTQGDWNTSRTADGSTLPSADFKIKWPDENSDMAFQNAWFYRIDGETRQFNFADATNRTIGPRGQSVTWEFQLTPKLYVELNISVIEERDERLRRKGSRLTQVLAFVNEGEDSVTIDVFNYMDLDAKGTPEDDSFKWNDEQDRFEITDRESFLRWDFVGWGELPDHHQATAFPSLRTSLTANAVYDLDDTVANSPGDFTGALQWHLTVGGQARILGSAVTAEVRPVPNKR